MQEKLGNPEREHNVISPGLEIFHLSEALHKDIQVHKINNEAVFVGWVNKWNLEALVVEMQASYGSP